MLLILGYVIVSVSMIGGFLFSGGNPGSLFVLGEYIIILGIAAGYMVASGDKTILTGIGTMTVAAFKGSPYTRDRYLEVIKALYELLMLAREQGVVGIEEHVMEPEKSSIFKKYPSFINDHHAVVFMQDALRPLVDGKVKAEELEKTLSEDLDRMHAAHAQPVSVMTKVGDALPGIGIVAAVLGIIITMGSIAGDKEVIGNKVAHALVGTFLGLLVSYGFVQPLVTKIEFMNEEHISYFEIISQMVVSFAAGVPPTAAAENARRVIPMDRQPGSAELEGMLKELNRK